MLVGIDEVGRGSMAGPLVVGVVSMSSTKLPLKDSKQLSLKQREVLNKKIYRYAKYAALGWAWPHEIDKFGLTYCTRIAILRAVDPTDDRFSDILIDGSVNFIKDYPKSRTLIKADASIPSVSAASIIAKVARDNYMRYMAGFLPEYGFASHVGYCTPEHLMAVKKIGPSCLHRLSYRPLSNFDLVQEKLF